MKKFVPAFLVLVVFVFTAGYSFYFFGNQKVKAVHVKGVETQNYVPMPKDAEIVSSNMTESLDVITYKTTLSLDQILSYYDNYAKFANWIKTSDYVYKDKQKKSIAISVQLESDEGNLVTFKKF